jgi:hypothetical protein
MTLPDLRGLVQELAASHVEFVVIGGVAVGLHGFIRATEDLDVVPDPARGNLDRLADLLERWSATLLLHPARRFGGRERWALQRGRNLSVSTPMGDLDVVRALSGVPAYDELLAACVRFTVDGVEIRVASTEHLIAMKRARASDLDRADIAALEEIGDGADR